MSFDDIILPAHANPIVLEWLKSGKAKIVESGCWEWCRYIDKEGYGRVRFKGSRSIGAHRVAVSIPKDLVTLHSCDNRKCINPSHLSHGTQGDNTRDMMLKGRGLRPSKRSYGQCECGRAKTYGSIDCKLCRSVRLQKKRSQK